LFQGTLNNAHLKNKSSLGVDNSKQSCTFQTIVLNQALGQIPCASIVTVCVDRAQCLCLPENVYYENIHEVTFEIEEVHRKTLLYLYNPAVLFYAKIF
jgi:hypothetical protein